MAAVEVAVVEAMLRVETERPPEKVEVALVEVAIKMGAVTVPVKTPAPFTPKRVPGVVVPMPTLPFPKTEKRLLVELAVVTVKMLVAVPAVELAAVKVVAPMLESVRKVEVA